MYTGAISMTEEKLTTVEKLVSRLNTLRAEISEMWARESAYTTYSPLTLEIYDKRIEAQQCLEQAVGHIPDLIAEIRRLRAAEREGEEG